MDRTELIDYLINEDPSEFKKENLDKLSNKRLFKIYCEWEGLIGFSDILWETVEKLTKNNN